MELILINISFHPPTMAPLPFDKEAFLLFPIAILYIKWILNK